MNLVIHDLSPDAWDAVRPSYEGWNVISDTGTIRPCVGCFSCWNRTPGQCVVKDGYENIGVSFHNAREIVVISRYTYGGFSGFVKNVFDRCLGYALPQFEVVDGQTHHMRRYDEDKPFSFIFYGHALTDAEKDSALRYVKALCANTRGHVGGVVFRERAEEAVPGRRPTGIPSGRTVLLNASMRTANGNTAKLARKLAHYMKKDPETAALKTYPADPEGLARSLGDVSDLVICTPLYLDGLPSQLIRFMEALERGYDGASKRVYVLANMGLYESGQLVNLFEAVRQWCGVMGFSYCGGLGVSAGELVGVLMDHLPFEFGFTSRIARGIKRLAGAVDRAEAIKDIYAEPFCFPRRLYIRIANNGWKKMARENGIAVEDLYRRL